MKRDGIIISVTFVVATMFLTACKGKVVPEETLESYIEQEEETVSIVSITQGITEFLGLNTGANGFDSNDLIALVDQYGRDLVSSAQGLGGSNGSQNAAEIRHARLRQYPSVDGQGKRVYLSADLYFPRTDGEIPTLKGVILNCHATKPQGMDQSMESAMGIFYSVQSLALEGYLVVEPDYIGFGDTENMMQTYLAQHLIARNCVDALMSAYAKAPDKGIRFISNYGTYVVGYSQGGGNALAMARYMAVDASEQQKNTIRLRHTFCGAGPYDPEATFNYWLEADRMCMSAVIPMVLFGHMEVYPDLYKGIKVEDYFSDNYIATGIIDDIRFHRMDLMGALRNDAQFAIPGTQPVGPMPWVQTSLLMSEQSSRRDSDIMKKVFKSLAAEDVTKDWTPDTPLTFYVSPTDNVVPPVNTVLAHDRLHAKAPQQVQDIVYSEMGDHITGQLGYLLKLKVEHMYLEPSRR